MVSSGAYSPRLPVRLRKPLAQREMIPPSTQTASGLTDPRVLPRVNRSPSVESSIRLSSCAPTSSEGLAEQRCSRAVNGSGDPPGEECQVLLSLMEEDGT